jgi:hypothetical protein
MLNQHFLEKKIKKLNAKAQKPKYIEVGLKPIWYNGMGT